MYEAIYHMYNEQDTISERTSQEEKYHHFWNCNVLIWKAVHFEIQDKNFLWRLKA